MTASLLSLGVERLHDLKPVFGVDPQQFEQDEPHGTAFVGGLGFDLPPQVSVDPAERVTRHGLAHGILPVGCRVVSSKLPAGCVDSFEMARKPSADPRPPKDPNLTRFIDTVIVPALAEKVLAEQRPTPAGKAS